jgi:hypothetical protein
MTFAEIVVFILLAVFIGFLLLPLQKWLERRLYRFFRSKNSSPGPIIDVTDYKKKDKQNE